jgi:hypothetical protein
MVLVGIKILRAHGKVLNQIMMGDPRTIGVNYGGVDGSIGCGLQIGLD